MARRPASRISILDVDPPAGTGTTVPRAVVGEWVQVHATLVRDGDAHVSALLRFRPAGRRRWEPAPLQPIGLDRHAGAFVPDAPGLWQVQIDAWTSPWADWRADVTQKVEGFGQPDYTHEIAQGCALLQPYREYPYIADTLRLVEEAEEQVFALVALLGVDALPDRHDLATLPAPLVFAVDPAVVADGCRVELPAEAAAAGGAVAKVAALGADIALAAGVFELCGTDAAARDAVARLGSVTSEQGLRLAVCVTPRLGVGHPWVVGDASWLRRWADGGVWLDRAPEGGTPAARVDFTAPGSADAVAQIIDDLFGWVGAGVTVFEVESADLLPLPVWEAVAAELRAEVPEAVLVARSPLRPALVRALGGVGFAQFSLRLDEVPSPADAGPLALSAAPGTGSSAVPRLRLAASGGAPLVVAATLGCAFAVDAPGNGATMLAGLLLRHRRELPALGAGAETVFLDTGSDRALAYLRRTPFDEVLVLASRDPEAPVTFTVDLPGPLADAGAGAGEGEDGGAGDGVATSPAPPAEFPALDLLAGDERRRPWGSGPQEVTLPAGGVLLLRLER